MSFPPLIEILPHRPPMILLDALTECDGDSATCAVTVREGAPFVVRGRVPSVVFMEYMAQAIGAYAGNIARTSGREVEVGYLIAAREIELGVDHASVGDRLVVTALRQWGDELVGSFRCEVLRDGVTLAHGVLSVYQGPLREGEA